MNASKRGAYDVLSSANARVLFDALDAIDGPKVIVWDPTLISRFNLVSPCSVLWSYRLQWRC